MSGANVDPALLVYAFRYALGRRTYAPIDVQRAILHNLDALPLSDRMLFVRETERALEQDQAGAPFDRDGWVEFMEKVRASL